MPLDSQATRQSGMLQLVPKTATQSTTENRCDPLPEPNRR